MPFVILMDISLGKIQNHVLEKYESQFKIPSIEAYFCNELANLYKPIIYGGDYSNP